MPRPERDRISPWILIGVGVALMAAAFFSCTGHPVRDSNLYASSLPAWIPGIGFVLTGLLMRVVNIRDRRREVEKKKRDPVR
jgi:uncharacterized membrane protein